eukprot:TRINITY_DN5240_c0_g2_i1.p1 TRINITY_DN5240_c0_g2~~TRINITY_DN5240_c0_g2_i1.p1  ORF type:complete len:225 (-),score=-5.46 TRINITY_DN5240_c0_g2_i1:277-951(-)
MKMTLDRQALIFGPKIVQPESHSIENYKKPKTKGLNLVQTPVCQRTPQKLYSFQFVKTIILRSKATNHFTRTWGFTGVHPFFYPYLTSPPYFRPTEYFDQVNISIKCSVTPSFIQYMLQIIFTQPPENYRYNSGFVFPKIQIEIVLLIQWNTLSRAPRYVGHFFCDRKNPLGIFDFYDRYVGRLGHQKVRPIQLFTQIYLPYMRVYFNCSNLYHACIQKTGAPV